LPASFLAAAFFSSLLALHGSLTPLTSRVMKGHLTRRREPFLSGTKAFSSRSQESAENAGEDRGDSPSMAFSFSSSAFSGSLREL
jgi:hypothetical protein